MWILNLKAFLHHMRSFAQLIAIWMRFYSYYHWIRILYWNLDTLLTHQWCFSDKFPMKYINPKHNETIANQTWAIICSMCTKVNKNRKLVIRKFREQIFKCIHSSIGFSIECKTTTKRIFGTYLRENENYQIFGTSFNLIRHSATFL